MTTDQTAPMTGPEGEASGEPCLILRADDGTTFVIPASVVEAHRLSDDDQTALEARLKKEGGDVEGFYYGPTGNVGTFAPALSGSWFPLWFLTNTNREDPNGYHPLVR